MGAQGGRTQMSSVIHALIWALEAIFVFGIVGAALVVILTSIEDVREVFSKEDGERLGHGQGELEH